LGLKTLSLILDSSTLIAAERRGETVKQLIERLRSSFGDIKSAISSSVSSS